MMMGINAIHSGSPGDPREKSRLGEFNGAQPSPGDQLTFAVEVDLKNI
jgi:hypothetical protein